MFRIRLVPVLLALSLCCGPSREPAGETLGKFEPTPEAPGDAIEPGVMELYPTWQTVGIEIPFTGDENGNSQARLFWRRAGENTWRNGVDFTFDRQQKLAWASIFPLEPGDSVLVRILFADPQPESDGRLEGAVSTRKLTLEPSGGAEFHVSPDGNDRSSGSKSRPFRTIRRALEKAGPGDVVLVGSGIYREGELLAGMAGKPGQPIVVSAEPGEKPVLDSALEIPAGHRGWKPIGQHAWKTFLPWDFRWHPPGHGEIGYGYLAQDGKRMFCYVQSLSAFLADSLNVSRAWYCDTLKNDLYVRTGLSDSPEMHGYSLATWPSAFLLAGARHVVVCGFEIRHYGTAGIVLDRGAKDCIVIDNEIHNVPWGVYLEGANTRDNAIWRNVLAEPGLEDFSWQAIKASGYPRQGIMSSYAGRGNSFCYNTLEGWFDGITALSWQRPDDLALHRDCDVMYNRAYNIGDDSYELDGGGVNLRVHGNTAANCLTAISLAPVERGPVYVTRNEAAFLGLLFKLNVGDCTSLGPAYVYHNSGYSLSRANGMALVSLVSEIYGNIPCTNKIFLNNAMIGSRYAVRRGADGNRVDYNSYWPAGAADTLRFEWNKVTYLSIAELAGATGMESHGLYADPLFVSTPGLGATPWQGYLEDRLGNHPLAQSPEPGDLSLRPGSPLIDRGVIIRGINDDWAGKAPDIGADEYGDAKTGI
ncbi:MAG: DUF1565 domain-containing protein [Candidatus Glassbacteria bacterium]